MKNPLHLYKNMNAPMKASFWFIICNVVQRGIAILTTPIFTRLLTTEQYGLVAVYQSWQSILIIFATLNLSHGVYMRGMTKYSEDRRKLTSSLQGLSTIFTLGLFLIYLGGMHFWTGLIELPPFYLLVMLVDILFSPALMFWSAGQRFDYRYHKLIGVTLGIAFFSPLVGILAVLSTPYKAEARVLSNALVHVGFCIYFYIYNLKRGKAFFDKGYWKYALAFNLPLIPHYLSMVVLSQSDRIMISRMVGKTETALYSVAYTVSMMMTMVTSAINSTWEPYLYKNIKSRNFSGIRKNANILLTLVGFGSIFAIAFGPEIIRIVAAPAYYDVIWVIPPVAASVYFIFLYPLFASLEFYYERTKFIMVASCVGAAMNIILNYIFIRMFGYYAAGYTTLACYILFSFAHYFFHRRILKREKLGVTNIYDMRFIVGFSVAVVVGMLLMVAVYPYMVVRYGVIFALCIVLWINRGKVLGAVKAMRE